MKSGWELRKLGDLFEITSSKRVLKSEWKKNGVPFYRAREIVKLAHQGFVNNELFISEEMFNKYSAKYGIPQEGDIMITGVGTLGVCYVVKEDDKFYFKDGNIIWLKKRSDTNSRFVEYAFKSDFLRKQIDDSIGATVGTYTIIKAKETLVPLPSVSEQNRLVRVLDKAFEGIATAKANTEKNQRNARAIFENYLEAIFTHHNEGSIRKKLGDVCELIMGQSPKGESYNTSGKGIPLINGPVEFSSDAFGKTIRSKFTTNPTKFCKENDLILCVRGSTTGRMNIAGFDACIGRGVAAIRARVYQPWINHFINYARKEIYFLGTGATFPNVSSIILSGLKLFFPSLNEQKQICGKLDVLYSETQRLESLYQQKITALDELKKSLLHQAFTGQL